MTKIFTRMGDGYRVEMSESELKRDLEEGTEDAADRGNIQVLSKEDLQYLFDIFASSRHFISVDAGNEVILSYDGGTIKMIRTGINVNRVQSLQIYEKLLGADTLEMAHIDYSYKPIKPIVGWEQLALEQALLDTIPPLFYGAMPNLGLYSQPDGPFPNPADLLPRGKIDEAQSSLEEAAECAASDIVYVASAMYESGADGINMDTVGGAGDADLLAGLKAAEMLKKKYPDICIELGMAGEFVLGFHGDITYDGVRLAGLYSHEIVDLAEKAGVTIFGPAINTNTSKSFPWNLSRALTFVNACSQKANIPIHVNMGMGVGAVTVTDNPPIDVLSRASTAMVEICLIDGL